MSNGLVKRLAMVFVAASCSLPVLLLLHAPAPNVDPSLLTSQGLQISSRQLRSRVGGATHLLPVTPGNPLPPPPPPLPDLQPPAQAQVQAQAQAPAQDFVDAKARARVRAMENRAEREPAAPAVPVAAAAAAAAPVPAAVTAADNPYRGEEEMLARMSDPPAMSEIIAYLDTFIRRLHQRFVELSSADKFTVFEAYRAAAAAVLLPFDRRWKGRNLFPVRDDDSIFISIASYRDHRLVGSPDPASALSSPLLRLCGPTCFNAFRLLFTPFVCCLPSDPHKHTPLFSSPGKHSERSLRKGQQPRSDIRRRGHAKLLRKLQDRRAGGVEAR